LFLLTLISATHPTLHNHKRFLKVAVNENMREDPAPNSGHPTPHVTVTAVTCHIDAKVLERRNASLVSTLV